MTNNKIITRFAPSPTGFLHIGSARTALFNWLYAKHVGGVFKLRIEDTDKERSTQIAVNAIINSLKWLEIDWDGEIIFQSHRQARHLEVANMLLECGKAYKCYMTHQEIENYKKANPYKKISSPWRDTHNKFPIPKDIKPTIRLKVQDENNQNDNNSEPKEISIIDAIQGSINVKQDQLDDMILIRSDGMPTYMLAVVVDDHDMGVNYVIRGDDHLTNTFRQLQIYQALSWPKPQYAHIPLIHNSEGSKLSKRQGAVGVEYYRDAGYLHEAVLNYLLRLGWSHGDQEIFSIQEATKLFDLKDVNKAPSRFDINKLNSINSHYIKQKSNEELLGFITDKLKMDEYINLDTQHNVQMSVFIKRIIEAMDQLKQRAKTINEMAELAKVYINKQDPLDEKSQEIVSKIENHDLIKKLTLLLEKVEIKEWRAEQLKNLCEQFATQHDIKPVIIMQILRAYVLGTFQSAGIYETLAILGKEEVIQRITAK